MKKVLILTAEMGFGHLSAAKAISSALKIRYGEACQVEINNLLDDERTPSVLRQSQLSYDRAVREQPELYRMGYELLDNQISSKFVEGAFTLMLLDVLSKAIKASQPDIIVVTRENYLAPLGGLVALNQLFSTEKRRIPVITTVTDLTTVHRLWFNTVSDYTFVSSKIAYDLAISYGLDAKSVEVTGVPVSPAFCEETRSKQQIREALGWLPEMTTLLVVGGTRVRGVENFLRMINHSHLPLQLVVIAGGDKELYEQLQKETWHLPTKIYNFATNMPEILAASDVIACKAGGLIVSEALACGLPILLIDLIQGQETGNAQYIVENQAGVLATEPIAALEALFHWLHDEHKELEEKSKNARALGYPDAAMKIAKRIWQTIENNLTSPTALITTSA